MAPLVKGSAAAAAMPPPPPPPAVERKQRRGRAAANEMYAEISALAGTSDKVTKAVIDAARAVCCKQLREHGKFRIPALVVFKMKVIPPKPAKTKKMFGKDVAISAKPERKRVLSTPLKQLTDMAVA